MLKPKGSLQEQGIEDLLRQIYREGRSGVLEIVQADQRRKLHFRRGELYLSASHPLAKRLSDRLARLQELKSEASGPGTQVRNSGSSGETGGLSAQLAGAWNELRALVTRMAEVIGSWQEGEYEWRPETISSESELVGPLPTAFLVMLGALPQREEAWLLAQLGGERAVWTLAGAPRVERDVGQLPPETAYLAEQLRQPREVRQLLVGGPMSRQVALEGLVQLSTAGLIRSGNAPSVEAESEELVDLAVVQRFSERIRLELIDQPVALGVDDHRERVSGLLANLTSMSYYELLAIGPHSSAEEVHSAYDRVARLVHPSHAVTLGLAGHEKALELLFETATRAYLVLCHPDRRRDYNEGLGIELRPTGPDPSRREGEQRALARHNYERALAMIANSEFHFAVELLLQAVKVDPRSEYYAALGRALARNPHWVRRAIDAMRQATELAPRDLTMRVELGRLYEQAADFDHARVQYITALKLDETNQEVHEALARLSPGHRPKGGGFFERFFGQ